MRRIPGRTLGGPRTRRSNMHFSSSSGLSALSPSGRESVDPIAELLSQLSGVRRGGPPTSQLQQLQMQMQMDRQQATVSIDYTFVCFYDHSVYALYKANILQFCFYDLTLSLF